jgi:hypothetical protein
MYLVHTLKPHFLNDILVLSFRLGLGLKSGSLLEFCMHFYSPCTLNALSVTSSLIWSFWWCLMSNTNKFHKCTLSATHFCRERVNLWRGEGPGTFLHSSESTCHISIQNTKTLVYPLFSQWQFTHLKNIGCWWLTVIMANLVCQLFPAREGMKRSLVFMRPGLWGISEMSDCKHDTNINRISQFPGIWAKLESFLSNV